MGLSFNRKQWDAGLGARITRVELHDGKRIFRGINTRRLRAVLSGAVLLGSEARDVGRTELGSESYSTLSRYNARDAIGGTWDLFRYPGIRSDSDMYTLGFPFRPWQGPTSIASGAQIRDYVQQTAHDLGVTERVHFGQRVERLEWSSQQRRWSVTTRTCDGVVRHSARFVYLATGYYSYEQGHVVDFPGQADFDGLQPQGMVDVWYDPAYRLPFASFEAIVAADPAAAPTAA